MKFRILSAAVMLCMAMPLMAQQLSGVIRESKNHQPLVGATVQLKESGITTISDADGKFTFTLSTPGNYTIVVKFIGYQTEEKSVEVSQDSRVEITLNEAYILTDNVVVMATRADDKTPATFTNVSKETIRAQNFGQDLPFLLNWTPSVVTTSDAGTGIGYTGLRIRGSDATRINVTINGIPYNDSESLGTFWVDIPDIASSSQSIQIQRGVGTSTNGAGAFGASINMQTNTRNDVPYAEMVTSAGSFKTFRNTLSFGTGLIRNKWVVDGRISNILSDGYIDRASSKLQSYYFSAGFYAGNTMLKGIAFGGHERTYQSWYGVPESRLNNDLEAMETTVSNEGWNDVQRDNLLNSNSRTFNPYTYENQVDDYGQNHYQLHFSQRISNAWSLNAAFHYTKGKGYYEEYRYDDDLANYGLPDDVVSSTDIIRRRWLDNNFYGATFSLNYEYGKVNSVLGGALNRYDGDHFGEILWSAAAIAPIDYQYYFNNGDKRDFNVYYKNTLQFTPKFNGYLDLQLRTIRYDASGVENKQNSLDFSRSYSFFNPKAGVVFQPTEHQQLYASISVANREPVRDDFVDSPGSTPKPERLINVEGGYRLSKHNLIFHANYYLMDYKDQLVLTGAVNDVGASIRTNADKSYRMGIELEGTYRFSRHFAWNANVTLSRNKISEFTEVVYDYGQNWDEYVEVRKAHLDTDISFSPSVIAGSGFTYTPIKGFEATLLTKYVGKQYLDNTQNDLRSIDAYVINDVRIKYSLETKSFRQLGISVLVNNFLNETYESNGYTWGYLGGGDSYRENYYYPQAGRNYMVMLTLAL